MAAKKKPTTDEGLSIFPHPAVTGDEPTAPPPPKQPPEPSLLADAPSLQADDTNFDIAADPPSAPVAPAVVTVSDPALEERIRHLETLLAQVQNLNQLEQRVAERVATQIQQRQPTPPQSSGPTVFGQARALLDVGRNLLPALPPGDAGPRPRGWLVWEMMAEVRAMVCMYLDPRYRLSWYGYVVPPVLFVAFLFTKYWLPIPFALTLEKAGLLSIAVVPVDLLLLYSMFKILGSEARRYRETAPDLPASLRL